MSVYQQELFDVTFVGCYIIVIPVLYCLLFTPYTCPLEYFIMSLNWSVMNRNIHESEIPLKIFSLGV
jgi:hypothetical protein